MCPESNDQQPVVAGRLSRHEDKRSRIAQHALQALADNSFARLNLRDIAARCGVSLGAIHYYFTDKDDLLVACVELYRVEFVSIWETHMALVRQPDEMAVALARFLAREVEHDANRHRLWYDVRAQGMFGGVLQRLVQDVEASMVACFREMVMRLGLDARQRARLDPEQTYVVVDGLFRYFLQRKLAGEPDAAFDLRRVLEQEINLRLGLI